MPIEDNIITSRVDDKKIVYDSLKVSYRRMCNEIDSLIDKRAGLLARAAAYDPSIGDPKGMSINERMTLISHLLAKMTNGDKSLAILFLDVIADEIIRAGTAGEEKM